MPENAIQNVCEKVFSGVSVIIYIETENERRNPSITPPHKGARLGNTGLID